MRALADRLRQLGRPIAASGITKVENGARRVDAGDLVALAVALDVNPNRLLLSSRADDQPVALTPAAVVDAWEAWQWADGELPLLLTDEQRGMRWEQGGAELHDDFRRHVRPIDLRLREDEPPARAARDVLSAVSRLLATKHLRSDPLPDAAHTDLRRAAAEQAPRRLRHAMEVLRAEVDRLLEEHPADSQWLAAWDEMRSQGTDGQR